MTFQTHKISLSFTVCFFAMSATATNLRCKLSRNFYQFSTSFFRFVRQYLIEGTPTHVCNDTSNSMIFHHIGNLKFLNTNQIKVIDKESSRFMLKISTAVFNLLVNFAKFKDGFLSVFTAFLFTGNASLSNAQRLLQFLAKARVIHVRAVREFKKAGNPRVQTDFFTCFRQCFNRRFNRKNRKPASALVFYRERLNFALNCAGKFEFYASDFRECEFIPCERKPALRKRETIITANTSESWKTSLDTFFTRLKKP